MANLVFHRIKMQQRAWLLRRTGEITLTAVLLRAVDEGKWLDSALYLFRPFKREDFQKRGIS